MDPIKASSSTNCIRLPRGGLMFFICVLALIFSLLQGCSTASTNRNAQPTINIYPPFAPNATIDADNLPNELVGQLYTDVLNHSHARKTLAVYIRNSKSKTQTSRVAMLGSYSLYGNTLRFKPRFPLQPGETYDAVLRFPSNTPTQSSAPAAIHTFTIQAQVKAKTARVVAVYPTSDVLPENLLKFYIEFSAPMRQGNVYKHLQLLDDAGKEIELPFLELSQELWSKDGKRLTVLFDPGRIKQGLKPREVSGPVMEAGKRYTFVIRNKWHDATGQPLNRTYRKDFKCSPPDITQPKPTNWSFSAPQRDRKLPLSITFTEPLDHALLLSSMQVNVVKNDRANASLSITPIQGQIQIDRHETVWRFIPDKPWAPGRYTIKIANTLEDRAGNSIGRPFEVDLKNKSITQSNLTTTSLPFTVK
jgi:hypothetical protein